MADTNIFITDLPNEVDANTLKMVFSSYGTVVWHKLMPAKGKPSQAAIVEYQNAAEAAWVVENVNGRMPDGIYAPVTITYKTAGKKVKGALGGQGGFTGAKVGGGMGGQAGGCGGCGGCGPNDIARLLASAAGGGNQNDQMHAAASIMMAAYQMGQNNVQSKNGNGAAWSGQKKNKWKKDKEGGGKFIDHKEYGDDQKVWLGNLPAETSDADLKEHMTMAGGTVILAARTKGSTGIAVFENGFQASVAVAQLNGTSIGINVIEMDAWAKPEKKAPQGSGDGNPAKKQKIEGTNSVFGGKKGSYVEIDKGYAVEQKVWIGNIPKETSDADLKEYLAMAGGTVLMAARMKGNTGVAVFENSMQAYSAISKLSGLTFGGQELQLDVWTEGTKKKKQ